MSLTSKTLPGFWNGVSQQPASQRLETMAELQENALGTLVDGLYPRPGTNHLSTPSTNIGPGAFHHKMDQGPGAQFMVFITTNTSYPVEIYDLTGAKKTVRYGRWNDDVNFVENSPDGLPYFVYGSATPLNRFRALTLSDRVLITNNEKPVSVASTAGTLTGTVQKFTDLPLTFTGEIPVTYKILGTGGTASAPYYVRGAKEFISSGSIFWTEIACPGQDDTPVSSTMPHVLKRLGDGTFGVGKYELWGARGAGDRQTCPTPSFVGKTITNLCCFKSRLGFLCDVSNVVLSRTGKNYSFYPGTALEVLDTDPIDSTISTAEGNKLIYTGVFDKSLYLVGLSQQLRFGSSDDKPLTPSTASSTPVTKYDCAVIGRPEAIGPNLYFVSPRETYAILREYFLKSDSSLTDAADVTAHIPRYIPVGEYHMASSSALDLLFLHSSGAPSTLFIYKFFWVGDEKPQASWSKWTFSGNIMGLFCFGSKLYVATRREYSAGSFQVTFECFNLENITTGSLGFRVSLDRTAVLAGTYAGGNTTFTLPYHDSAAELVKYQIVHPTTGIALNIASRTSTNTLVVTGDYSGINFFVGKNFTMRYRLSEWIMKDDQKRPILSGRLQVRKLHLDIINTGYFRVEVTPVNRETVGETVVAETTGQKVSIATLGSVPLLSGRVECTVMAKAQGTLIDIVNDTYLPCFVQTGELEGFYWNRSKSRSS